MRLRAPSKGRSALLPGVAAPVKVATAAGFVVLPAGLTAELGGAGGRAPTGLDDTGAGLWICGLSTVLVVGLLMLSETVVPGTDAVVAGFHGTVISQGQSVMVSVVASVTVKVLVPCVNVVGPGQKVV